MLDALRRTLGSQGDLVLVACMIGILIVLFTPIPTFLLDFLLIANFCFALLILLLTFYMGRPLEFSTFPSLLLMATLFRLSLNIAATRLILGNADAGRVISAMGTYVVHGNYVIGLIVFLVLVVVQYVVVTNGAQRVAEVAARFTLDSMPGKQMSIDADLNMGLIDEQGARARRKQVEKEANFYGAMDGASRFVKGDAIAGILIILIDIIGGLTIGVAQMGMGWAEALHRFTLLTVGDGIVTQVPALVIATGTGIIVTRAATDAQLSAEIGRQIVSYPKTLVLVCIGLFTLLLLPGIPAVPVLILLAVGIVLSIVALRARARLPEEEAAPAATPAADAEELYQMLTVEPIEITIGQNLIPVVGEAGALFMDRIAGYRKQYALEKGFVIPKVRIKDNKKLAPNSYEIRIFGTRAGGGEVLADRTLAINPGGNPAHLEGVETRDPTYGLPAVWVVDDLRHKARTAGYTLVDPATVLMTHISEVVRQQSPNLLTRGETERLVDRVKQQQPGLVDELIPNILTMGEVQKVLQNLLREKVAIRPLEFVLEVLADNGRRTKDVEQLTELVRQKLGPSICQGLANKEGDLHVLTLDPAVEQNIAGSIRAVDEASTLVMEPRVAEQLLKRLAAEVEAMMKNNLLPVLLCAPHLRRHIRAFTARVMPHLSVVSVSEVPNNVNLKAFAMVSL